MELERPRSRFWPFTMPARDILLQALVLLVLLMAVYPGVFLRGESVIPGDILLQYHPWDQYAPAGFDQPQNRLMVDVVAAFSMYYWTAKGSLEAGEWPLWNPFEYLGMPLMANMQSAVFYPPRLLHTFLDIIVAQNVYVLLKLWLCGMTAFLCGKVFGLKTWTSRFFSVAWMLASYNLIWASWPLADVAAWLPVVFIGVEFTLRGLYRRGFFATALGGTLLLLAGHPETAFAMAVWLGFYFAMRLAAERRWGKGLWLPLATQSGAWTLVLLFCASSLVPFVEYLTHSDTYFNRQVGDCKIPLALGTLVTSWVPRFFGTYGEKNYWGSSGFNSHLYAMVYPGIAVWLGLTLLLVRGEWRRLHRTRLLCLGGSALLCLLIGFNIPALAWVNRLPFFQSMLVSYHAAGAMFALPLLAACGVEHWLSQPRKLRELAWTLTAIVPAFCATVLLCWFNHPLLVISRMVPYTLTQMVLAGTFAVLSLIALGSYAIRGRKGFVCGMLIVVFAVDMLSTSQGMNPSVDPKYVFPKTKLTTFLQGIERPARIGTGEGYVASGLMPVYGIEELLGYDGLYPARIKQLTETVQPGPWKAIVPALAVGYYLNDPRFEPILPLKDEPDRYQLLGVFDGLEVYRDKRALPRAFLVSEARSVEGLDEFLRLAGQPGFDPARVAYVEGGLPEPLPKADSTALAGAARIVSRTFTHVAVEVDAKRRGVLVLADAYYPGWRATVDGRPARIFPVDHVLRGVVVEQGTHRVAYEYFPESFRVGLTLSVAACLGSIAWIALVGLRKRTARVISER